MAPLSILATVTILFALFGSFVSTEVNFMSISEPFKMDVEFYDKIDQTTYFYTTYSKGGQDGVKLVAKQPSNLIYNHLVIPKLGVTYDYQEAPTRGICEKTTDLKAVRGLLSDSKWNWIYNDTDYAVGPAALLMNFQKLANFTKQASNDVDTVKSVNCDRYNAKIDGVNVDVFKVANSGGRGGYEEGMVALVELNGSINGKKISQQYSFLPLIRGPTFDNNLFSLPIGYGCPGLPHDSSISGSFYARTGYEFYATIAEIDLRNKSKKEYLSSVHMLYSSENQFFVLDSLSFSQNKSVKPTRVKTTNDLKYGYQYTYIRGQCTVQKMVLKLVAIQVSREMTIFWPSPAEVFNFKDSQYLGESVKNGLEVSVFEKMVELDEPEYIEGKPVLKKIYTLYQSGKNIRIETLHGIQNHVPLVVEVRFYDKKLNFVPIKTIEILLSQFTGVLVNDNLISTRNVHVCTDSYQSGMTIELTFKGKMSVLSDSYAALSTMVPQALVDATDAPPYMFKPADIKSSDKKFYASVYIRNRPSAVNDFYDLKKGVEITEDGGSDQGIYLYEEDCAKRCLQYERSTCKFYSYCDNSCVLYVGKGSNPKTNKLGPNINCTMRRRIEDTYNSYMKFIDEIESDIYMKIEDSSVDFGDDDDDDFDSISVSVRISYKEYKFKAVEIIDNLPVNENFNWPERYGFEPVRGKLMSKSLIGDTIEGTTDHECGKECFNSPTCLTFDYCIDGQKKTCYLSNITPKKAKSHLSANNKCIHYYATDAAAKNNRNSGKDQPKSSANNDSDKSSGVTKEAVAGAAIATLLIGAIITTIAIFFYKRRRVYRY